ncbi:hypothetical protein BRD01_03610 [Halobacteriales archaeon QS_8_65_32]|nr:MAG: hypothetical protein BRD01_03610 [Halobacteriales archaeon QS_8_65_32]
MLGQASSRPSGQSADPAETVVVEATATGTEAVEGTTAGAEMLFSHYRRFINTDSNRKIQ